MSPKVINATFSMDSLPSVGDAELDYQHRTLLRLCLEATASCDRGLDSDAYRRLTDFADLLKLHFISEEERLQAVNYHDLSTHKQLHIEIGETLSSLLASAASGRCAPVDIFKFLLHWFENHVLRADLQFAPCLTKR